METKKCSRCGRELPTTEFNWANRATGKLQSMCRSCCSRYNKDRIEAHHHDYARPLDVIWLCTPCHRRMDARRREREGLTPYGTRKK